MSVNTRAAATLAALFFLCALAPATPPRDGTHDFDWDSGTWQTHQRRLIHPLTGSTTWVTYTGTDVVSKVWNGAYRATIEADGSAGHLEIFSVRLYDSDSHQWSIYFTHPGSGSLTVPLVGGFANGRGEFIDQEPYQGRMILVRFSVSDFNENACHFEQAFSDDGGKSWEVNFVVDETRVSG